MTGMLTINKYKTNNKRIEIENKTMSSTVEEIGILTPTEQISYAPNVTDFAAIDMIRFPVASFKPFRNALWKTINYYIFVQSLHFHCLLE